MTILSVTLSFFPEVETEQKKVCRTGVPNPLAKSACPLTTILFSPFMSSVSEIMTSAAAGYLDLAMVSCSQRSRASFASLDPHDASARGMARAIGNKRLFMRLGLSVHVGFVKF